MSTLRAILELQGSLDTAVIRTADPRVAEIADRFLPGTSANPQWYREIEAFMFPDGADSSVPEDQRARTDADPNHALEQVFADTDAPRLTIPEASRLMFGLGAVVHLTRNVPIGVSMPFEDPTEGPERSSLLEDVLLLTAPEDVGIESNLDPREAVRATIPELIEVFAEQFTGWQDWPKVAETLAEIKVLTEEAASVPLCLPSVVDVGGIESVVVDTEFSSDKVSLNNLKAVVDPNNWHDNYPSFFCKMEYKGLRTDGWRRVLETVGFCDLPYSRRLRTMLKYHKNTVDVPGSYEARLDYDLNDPVPDPWGDRQITVDRGFINMWSPKGDPGNPPVFVRTRKVAHITGLRPYTMKRFVCACGYAYAAMEMLFGSAKHPDAVGYRKPWLDPPEIPTDPSSTGSSQAKPKPHPDNSAASTAITMVAQCAEEMTAKQFDLADKWLAGQLTVDDLATYSAEVGARIASEPWRIIQAISKSKGAGK
jgi:hypothetical protein